MFSEGYLDRLDNHSTIKLFSNQTVRLSVLLLTMVFCKIEYAPAGSFEHVSSALGESVLSPIPLGSQRTILDAC